MKDRNILIFSALLLNSIALVYACLFYFSIEQTSFAVSNIIRSILFTVLGIYLILFPYKINFWGKLRNSSQNNYSDKNIKTSKVLSVIFSIANIVMCLVIFYEQT